MVKCPYCNIELDWDDIMDSGYTQSDEHYADIVSFCTGCRKSFRWTEYYKYDRFEELRELEE